MKKRILFVLSIVYFVLFLFGCQMIDESLVEQRTIPMNDPIVHTYDDESEFTESEPDESESQTIEDDIEPAILSEPEETSVQEEDPVTNLEEDEATDIQIEQEENIVLEEEPESTLSITEGESYTSKDDVALYIHTYGELPPNYITKKEAQELGWNNKENTMAEVLPGRSIGGDYFGNYEGKLPKEKGRSYSECDIDYVKGGRNAKRIVYSNDGLIYFTEDHYTTFEQLY